MYNLYSAWEKNLQLKFFNLSKKYGVSPINIYYATTNGLERSKLGNRLWGNTITLVSSLCLLLRFLFHNETDPSFANEPPPPLLVECSPHHTIMREGKESS